MAKTKPYRIVCLPDLHFPFHHQKALKLALAFIEQQKPTHVVQLGDLYDFFALSRFPKSYNTKTSLRPIDEIEKARILSEDMWKAIRKLTPRGCQHIQLLGNHDNRLSLRMTEQLPEILGVFDYSHLFEFPGVYTHHDLREPFFIHGIAFEHGYLTQSKKHAEHNRCSTVHGHTHRGSVTFLKDRNRSYFAMECGYLGDPSSAALSYTKSKFTNWTLGVGYIDAYGPRFVPLDKKL